MEFIFWDVDLSPVEIVFLLLFEDATRFCGNLLQPLSESESLTLYMGAP